MTTKTEPSLKELDLNAVAEEFDMISDGTYLFYNRKTGEFDFYTDLMEEEGEVDPAKFKGKAWVATPSQYDIHEYRIMANFAEIQTDSRKNELLCVALEGSGAFRRFKDTLHRVDLTEEWYAFKHKAYIEIARKWCDDNNIKYSEVEVK